MEFYFLVGLLASFFAYLGDATRAKSRSAQSEYANSKSQSRHQVTVATGSTGRNLTVFDLISASILAAFCGLRVNVGSDYTHFSLLYNAISTPSKGAQVEESQLEYGYRQLTRALHEVDANVHFLFLTVAVITIFPVYIRMVRHSERAWISVLLFILLGGYLAPFTNVRQGIAIALAFVAFPLYSRGQRRFWVAVNFLAVMFHKSALILALIQSVTARLKPSARVMLGFALTGVMVALVLNTGPGASLLGSFDDRYLVYVNGTNVGYSQVSETNIGLYLQIGFRVVLLLGVLLAARHLPTGLSKTQSHQWVFAASGLIFLVAGVNSVAIARLDDYVKIHLALLLSNVATGLPLPQRRFLLTASIGGGLVFFIAYLARYGHLVPYHSVFLALPSRRALPPVGRSS